MTLPIPKDNPLIDTKKTFETSFFDIDAPEDSALLATGAWDKEPDDEKEENTEGVERK